MPWHRQAGCPGGDPLRNAEDRGSVLPADGEGGERRATGKMHPAFLPCGWRQAEKASGSGTSTIHIYTALVLCRGSIHSILVLIVITTKYGE